MLYISENLKSLRKAKGWTQEEMAEMIGISPQSVSKWERGDTCPDISLLPALANLYQTSIDSIIGMDKINDKKIKAELHNDSHECLRSGNYAEAASILSKALKTFPNDEGIMSELAMALALDGGLDNLSQAQKLCEHVLNDNTSNKVHHTTRAALCFVHLKAGQKEKAIETAKNLPHERESREVILAQLAQEPADSSIDAYLKYIAIGEYDL